MTEPGLVHRSRVLVWITAAWLVAGSVPASVAGPDESLQRRTIGTIRASFDGEGREWFVVSGTAGDREQPGAFWLDLDERRMAVVGGYDTEEIDFSTFEFANGMPSSTGTYTGSVMSITFPFVAGQNEASFEAGEVGMAFIYVADVANGMDPAKMYQLSEGSLAVRELRVDASSCTMAGSFAGTLTHLAEDSPAIRVTEGTFEVDGCQRMPPA